MRLIKQFKCDQSGSVVLMFAFMILVLIGVAGMAVDYAYIYNRKSAGQQAADSAVMAFMSTYLITTDEDKARQYAAQIFNENLDNDDTWKWELGPVKEISGELHVSAKATTTLQTMLIWAIGINESEIGVATGAAIPIRSITAIAALDISGSMEERSMKLMRIAVKQFGVSMFNMVPAFKSRLEMGIVPYAGSVNISQASKKSAKLLGRWQYAAPKNTDYTNEAHYKQGSGCNTVADKHVETPLTSRGSTKIRTVKHVWERKFIGLSYIWMCVNKGIERELPWSGCLQTTQSEFSSSQRLRNNSVPPYPPIREKYTIHHVFKWICPGNENSIRVNVKSASQYDRFINKLSNSSSTEHDVGLMWARRVMEPNWASFFGTQSRPWNNEDYPKYLIHFSDGISWPFVFPFGDYKTRTPTSIDYNARQICNDLKDKGVTIISISYYNEYDRLSRRTVELLEECASEDMHFSAEKSNLEEIFVEISDRIKLRGLRLVK